MHEPLTTTQAAALLGCQAAHVRTLCDGGQLVGAQHDANGRWQIPAAAVTAYLASWAGKGRPRGRGSGAGHFRPGPDELKVPASRREALANETTAPAALGLAQLEERAARAEHLEFELSAVRLDLAAERIAAAEARAAHAEHLAAVARAAAGAAQEALVVLTERLKELTGLTETQNLPGTSE